MRVRFLVEEDVIGDGTNQRMICDTIAISVIIVVETIIRSECGIDVVLIR